MQSNGRNGKHTPGKEWCLARTRSLSEYMAAAALERSGYELYFPRVLTPRPRNGHSDTPLFPGYLFVRIDRNGAGLPPVRHVAGMLGWVHFDSEVPSVPDEVITGLDSALKVINERGGSWRRFQPGDQVRVSSGKVEGLAEVLEEPSSPQSRVRVLLNFMGRNVPARVPWHDLEPVGDGDTAMYPGRPHRRTRGRGRWINGFGPRAATDDVSTSRG